MSTSSTGGHSAGRIEVRISTLSDARGLVLGGWPSHVISMVDPGTSISAWAPHHLVVEVNDITSGPGTVPAIQHVREVIQFARAIPDSSRLLVHCHAGIGRSPATLMGVLAARGVLPQACVDTVAGVRPYMMPNTLLVALFDRELELGGILVRVVDEFRARPVQGGLIILGR